MCDAAYINLQIFTPINFSVVLGIWHCVFFQLVTSISEEPYVIRFYYSDGDVRIPQNILIYFPK